LPATTPNFGLRNWVSVAFMSALVWSFGKGINAAVLTGTIAAESLSTFCPGVCPNMEKAVGPGTQLPGVHAERVIGVTPEIGAGVAAASIDALWCQEQVDVEYNPPFPELVT
jgi:hypothetical protein